MTSNQLTTRPEAPTPQHDKSLSQQGLEDHRAEIAFEVKVILSAYYQPFEVEEIKAAQLAWWCDELVEWKIEQIVFVLRKWNEDNPRIRPTPGDILAMLKDVRGRNAAKRMRDKSQPTPEPDRDFSPEAVERRRKQSAELLRVSVEMPRPQSEAETRANINAAKERMS